MPRGARGNDWDPSLDRRGLHWLMCLRGQAGGCRWLRRARGERGNPPPQGSRPAKKGTWPEFGCGGSWAHHSVGLGSLQAKTMICS